MRGVPEAIERYRSLFEAGDEPFANEIVVCEVRAGTLDEELPSYFAFFEPVRGWAATSSSPARRRG
jgi:hypothetical protein